MKNTKGKWTWIADEHSVPSIYKSDDLTFRIAKLWGNTPKDRQIANLIASAPEMLELLKKCYTGEIEEPYNNDELNAFISKVEERKS
tara:strand:- start:215 stop:475 length:261 start_codon:yes stop_codon:yes gene_type:complete